MKNKEFNIDDVVFCENTGGFCFSQRAEISDELLIDLWRGTVNSRGIYLWELVIPNSSHKPLFWRDHTKCYTVKQVYQIINKADWLSEYINNVKEVASQKGFDRGKEYVRDYLKQALGSY